MHINIHNKIYYYNYFLKDFIIYLFIYLFEREREKEQVGGGADREGQEDKSAPHGAQSLTWGLKCGAQSHDPEIMT